MPEPISDENIRPRINRQRRRLYDPIVADPKAPKTLLPGHKSGSGKQRRRRLYDPIVADPEAPKTLLPSQKSEPGKQHCGTA